MSTLHFFRTLVHNRNITLGIIFLWVKVASLYACTASPWGNTGGDFGLQPDSLTPKPGIALFVEGIGKGYFSLNADFPLAFHHRVSVGFTQMDYDTEPYENYLPGPLGATTAGLMYYYLYGKRKSFLELGAGFSLFHRWDLDYLKDSPPTWHGVIGYRYHKKNGMLFRAGFTPFKRVNSWFLPLFGVSLGYSW